MRTKGQSQSLFVKIMKSPIRALCKARDFYVRSITNCSDQMNYSNNMDAVGRFAALPRSYSANSSRSDDNDDFKELMRAASARTMANGIDMDLILRQQQQRQKEAVGKGLPKSSTVTMGRIDEDKPVDFAAVVVPDFYPRSRSYAVPKSRAAVF